MTVSERIVAQLAAAGVRRAYTVPGESFLPLLDACDRHPDVALISTRHESGAAFMAEADAKVTGRPALAMATRGVGAANLSIGVHTASQDSTPMVVILGQVESAFLGREAFQEVDLPSFYREITKWAVTAPSSERLPELVGRAIHVATSGRPGPVMIGRPADLFDGDAGPEQSHLPGVVDRDRPTPSERTSERIADVLRDAVAPVMIVGGGGGTRGMRSSPPRSGSASASTRASGARTSSPTTIRTTAARSSSPRRRRRCGPWRTPTSCSSSAAG